MNVDFGNSNTIAIIDGYLLEMTTVVSEINREKAVGFFVANVDNPQEMYDRILISYKDRGQEDSEERYFLVGEAAAQEQLANEHIGTLHNKVKSNIPYAIFLAIVAYYQGIRKHEYENTEDNKIVVEYFQTMLPIWLLKKANKFSEMQKEMAERFKGEHEVKILTPGLEKTIDIHVVESKCRIEGEVARWAIKKTFSLEDNPEARPFKNNDTVVVDIGGGTVDLALLPEGLEMPLSRNDMQHIDGLSYLNHLENLRKEKLVEYFKNVRELDTFILKNIGKSQFIINDGNTGEITDLTNVIQHSLLEYTKIVLEKIVKSFPTPKDKVYKYLYIGGVAEILEDMIKDTLEKKFGREIAQKNHIFLPDSRKLNLYGLEILSINETIALKSIKAE